MSEVLKWSNLNPIWMKDEEYNLDLQIKANGDCVYEIIDADIYAQCDEESQKMIIKQMVLKDFTVYVATQIKRVKDLTYIDKQKLLDFLNENAVERGIKFTAININAMLEQQSMEAYRAQTEKSIRSFLHPKK